MFLSYTQTVAFLKTPVSYLTVDIEWTNLLLAAEDLAIDNFLGGSGGDIFNMEMQWKCSLSSNGLNVLCIMLWAQDIAGNIHPPRQPPSLFLSVKLGKNICKVIDSSKVTTHDQNEATHLSVS